MATKRTSFLKRQKEQKRIEKAMQKREDRMQKRFEQPDGNMNPLDTDSDEEGMTPPETDIDTEATE